MSTVLNSYVAERETVKQFCQRCRCATSDVTPKEPVEDGSKKVCAMCKKPRLNGWCGLTPEMMLLALKDRPLGS